MRVLLITALLVGACAPGVAPAERPRVLRGELAREYFPSVPPDAEALAPGMPQRQAVLRRATELLGIPYVWGGDTTEGLDCSSYVSLALATSARHTTDTLRYVATEIARDELLPGDLLNLPTWDHPLGWGHVRMFAAWANAERTPMRYDPLFAELGTAVLIVPDPD